MSQHPECLKLLEPQLSPRGNLEWLVYEQPVIALFSKSGNLEYTDIDREYLGQTYRHDGDLGLMLSVAHDEEANKLLVVLSQKIVISRRKPRILYMFVPIESLAVETVGPAFWTMTGGVVPLCTIDEPNDARIEQSSRLLRTSFSLAAKSWVIMPNQPHLGPVSDESMSTLRKLKSLSEASCFDLFAAYNLSAQQGLSRVKSLLQDTAVTGFKVNYDRFYPGGRSAVVGAWRCQGWLPQEEGVQSSSSRGVKRKHGEVTGGDSLPPSYDSAASGAAPEVTSGVASTASFDMALILYEEDAASGQESGQESILSEIYPPGRSISPPTVVETPLPLSPNFVFTPVGPQEAPPSYGRPVFKAKGSTATGHRNVLVNWLAALLRRDPLIHYTCITDLLALGMAAQAGDARAIRGSRAKCLTTHLRHQVVRKTTPERNEVEDLVSWLLVLDPETGDMMFLEQLAEASKAWESGQGIGPTPRSSFGALFSEPGSPVVVPDFVDCKAGIIIDACMAYGHAWEHRGVLLRATMDFELFYR